MLHASKTPDESGNYNHLMRVTYRFEISMRNRVFGSRLLNYRQIGLIFVYFVFPHRKKLGFCALSDKGGNLGDISHRLAP